MLLSTPLPSETLHWPIVVPNQTQLVSLKPPSEHMQVLSPVTEKVESALCHTPYRQAYKSLTRALGQKKVTNLHSCP